MMRGLMLAAAGAAAVFAMPAHAAEKRDYQAAIATLDAYKKAIEKRDLAGVEPLFAPDAEIFESGGVEGNFVRYRDHHLGPELKGFKSFTFPDYKVSVRGEGDIAVATETYRYSIELADGKKVERNGVATSVLKWSDGKWRIISLHSSTRRLKAAK